MSKKLILFLMVLLFGSTSFLRADELTIHDGTGNNSYVPVYGLYADAYLKCEMVFPAEELADMTNGTISGITFYATTPAAAAWTATWQVFVAEVENATISDFAGPGTVVYEGTLDGTQSSMTITFSAPYTYNGGNLLVGVYCTEKGNYKSVTWGGETVEGASVQGYNYNSLSGVTASPRDFLPKTTFVYTPGSQPTPPTGELTITPNDFTLGERPANGWMEPLSVRINNSAEPVTVTATLSNTSGVGAITMEPALIQDLTLETGDEVALTISTATGVTAGEYAEEFTMFTVNAKNIATIPVTATLYTAGEADIVETAKTIDLSYTSGVAEFTHTPANLHANYLLAGMTEMTTDAVYKVTLAKDAKVTVNNNVVYYNYVSGLQLSPAVEPAFTAEANEEITVLAGTYYMVVTDYVDGNVEGTVEQIPAPTALTALTPADGATEVESPVTLTWEGGENAAQYQVLFGTSPVNMPAVLDWTMVDENYGSYTVSGLQANTQYFWQIKAKNSNGTVQTVRRGFTTALTAPNQVTASATEIFTDESTLIKWKHSSGTMGDLPETQIGSGTSTNSYLPTYNFYNYSLSEQIYTSEELGGEAGYINSISFYPVGAITRNLKVYLANTDKETFTSGSDWVAMTEENLVYEGNVDMVANTWVTINFADAFEYEGGNLILAVTDHTGTYTSSIYYNTFDATAQAINVYQDSAPYNALAPVGNGTVRNFKNQIIINKDGAKGNTANRGFIGYNVYYGDVKANDALITEKQFLLENLPYNMTGHDINVTAVYDEGESGHSTPIVTVKVSGYATLEGTVTTLATEQGGNEPLAGATVTFYGKDEFNNDVNFETTTDDNGDYSVTVKAGIYNRGVATYAGMEPASMAEESVTVAYEGTETVNFIIHEEYKPVLSVYAEEINPSMSKVTWSLNTVISGGGSGGNASTFTEGFESGMPEGWTVVDANNDGTTWTMTSDIPSVWPYYASLTLDWYRTGTNAICSGSYVNGVGALNPDEYLVMGQQNIANGSTLSFWAAATDASYPADHFGVAVSDDATTWTMVQEWTLTGKKGANGGRESRDGNGAKLGTWYNYTVDLSAYAGQKYIAIRHFNCYDQYIMCVDDIELAAASKDRSLDHYAVYRKAILKENEIVPADSLQLVDGYTDTLYADFTWNNMEPGLYQYGVQAVYPTPIEAKGGNRDEIVIGDPTSTTTNSYLPTYSLYEYSLTEQIYTADEIGMAGTINTLTMWLKNSSSYARNINVYMKEADVVTFADGNAWVSMEDSDMVASFTLANGISSPVETAIALNTPFNYSGNGNLVICFQDVTGSWSSGAASVVMTGNGNQAIYAYRDGTVYNPTTPGVTGNVTANKSVIMLDITPGGGGNDNPVTPITWSNILPKDMETTVTVNAVVAAGTAEGATVIMTNTFEDIVFAGEFDETGTLVFPEFRKGNYVVTVDLEGYTSDYAEREVSIWDETELTATLTEIYKPVEEITVSVTGYAMWTPIVPVDRIAEKYFVQLNGVYYGETTDNFMQIDEDVLIENEQYTVGVAVVYSTGMSAYVTKNFTYLGCEGVATQVEELAATNEPGDLNVILTWNGGTPTPPTPPTGDVTIVLQADDVWGDGSGYQMLLDDTHSLYGTTIPETGALSLNCTGNDAIYAQFSHKIPTNADGNCSTSNMVNNSSVSITIPAGTYDWCITNPTPGDRIWIASSNGTIGGRYDDYTFEAGYTYTFHVYLGGTNDATDLTITGGKGMYQPNMGIMSNDVKTTNFVANNNVMNAGEGFGAAANQMTRDWYYYDNGVNEDAIGTGGGNFWWGIMLPAGSYEGNKLTKVSAYDYMAMTGTVTIYQGGTSAPGTALGNTNVTFTGVNDFVEFTFAEPIEIDATQNIWVVFYNGSGATYPAAVCANTGDPNGRWVTLDGTTWEDLAGYGLNYTFMIRAYIEQGGGTPATSLVPNKYNIFVDGEIVGATAQQTYTYEVADWDEHDYAVMWVSANYDMSCLVEITYAGIDAVEENNEVINAIYPNPTSGDLHINATAMKHISIINTMGQVVYEQDVNNDETVINMAKFESGVYMVNIITENGSSVKRVTVTK